MSQQKIARSKHEEKREHKTHVGHGFKSPASIYLKSQKDRVRKDRKCA